MLTETYPGDMAAESVGHGSRPVGHGAQVHGEQGTWQLGILASTRTSSNPLIAELYFVLLMSFVCYFRWFVLVYSSSLQTGLDYIGFLWVAKQ